MHDLEEQHAHSIVQIFRDNDCLVRSNPLLYSFLYGIQIGSDAIT